jgi:hypothetical protein
VADRKKYARETFHVFDRVILLGEELTDGTESEHYQVFLSDWQIQNLKNGCHLPLDFNALPPGILSAAERKRAHGEPANRILGQGIEIRTEQLSYRWLQKNYGRRVKARGRDGLFPR